MLHTLIKWKKNVFSWFSLDMLQFNFLNVGVEDSMPTS